MTPTRAPGLHVLPVVLFLLLTLMTFVGPVVLWQVMAGGEGRKWPPDRPIEWWAFGLIVGGGVGLTAACVGSALWFRPGRGSRG